MKNEMEMKYTASGYIAVRPNTDAVPLTNTHLYNLYHFVRYL